MDIRYATRRGIPYAYNEPYDAFIQRVKTNPLAVAVKINDLTDNMDIRRIQGITDRDVERLRKYLIAYQELIN